MTRVEIASEWLNVEILGWHKIWAFKSRIKVQLDHVTGIRRLADDEGWLAGGLRMPGTCLPGVIKAGSYYRQSKRKTGEWSFWDVGRMENALVIELRDEKYARLVLEVKDPEATLEMLQNRVR
jgi:hypothetical protein